MGTFSIWHWAIVLLPIAVPILAIATENSGHRLRRGGFALWVLAAFAVGLSPQFLGPAVMNMTVAAALVVIFVAVTFFFYRAVVQRLRDAGNGKGLAYVGVIPVLNLVIAVYLLFVPSKDIVVKPEGGDADFGQEGTA